MKTNLITMAFSSLLLGIVILSSRRLLSDGSAHTRYYITAAALISAALLTVTIVRFLLIVFHRPSALNNETARKNVQRREYFRLTYDNPPQPLFVQTDGESPPDQLFTCHVRDLSEIGLALCCSGVYDTGQTVIGEVIFSSGRKAQINGEVIRQDSNITSLALHCSIEPTVFMAEQRDMISEKKNVGPKPAVSQSLFDKPSASLPSYSPKGVCLKKKDYPG